MLTGANPFIAFERRVTGSADPVGKPDIDVKDMRRPAFFGRAPYGEPIAAAEPETGRLRSLTAFPDLDQVNP